MDSMANKSRGRLVVLMAAMLSLAAADAVANLIVNPGFEDPVTMDGAPFVGSWEAFNAGAGSAAFNSTVDPLSGAQHLELSITSTVNAFAGVFQDVVGLSSGQILTFSGWSMDVGTNAGGSEIRIEWRDSVGDVEIARTPNLVPVLTNTYTQWMLMDAVPDGADLARVVYAIQSFSAGPNQNVYVDDVALTSASVTALPEPASLALLGLGGLIMFRRRRVR